MKSFRFKKMLSQNEFYIFLTIVALTIVIEMRSGQFFTPNNLVDIISAMIVPGMFAVGAFIVIVSGGIDVSFPALASLATYATTRILVDTGFTGSPIVPFLMVMAFGLILGAFNGFLISMFSLPTIIITLGTQSVFRGIMQGVLSAVQIPKLPVSIKVVGESFLLSGSNAQTGLTSKLPSAVLLLALVLVLAYFVLNYTMFGRGIYAIGGDENSANRAGFNVRRIKFLVYCIVGMLAGVAGLTRTALMGQMHPTNLLGSEMIVIAAVVLGGTAITGGSGSLTGTMLGMLLLTIVQTSMLLLGIPTFWQGFFTGLLIIVGTGISAYQVMRTNNRLPGLKDV